MPLLSVGSRLTNPIIVAGAGYGKDISSDLWDTLLCPTGGMAGCEKLLAFEALVDYYLGKFTSRRCLRLVVRIAQRCQFYHADAFRGV